jgi:hypothetical protein
MPLILGIAMGKICTLIRFIRREPVACQGCVQATLAALVGFGVINWSSEQVGLMLAVVAAFLALFTRAVVSPMSTPAPRDQDAGDAPAEPKTPLAN